MPSALEFLQRGFMRRAAWSTLLGAIGIGLISAPPGTDAIAAPRVAQCLNPGQALGVSRVVEVDTSNGPHFGHQQYKDIDLLAPGEVVLTFDDGPLRPHTQPIIDALEAQCTKATFFMVGSQAIADPDIVRQIMRKGHTVGTHTWSHANLRKATPLTARKEIELGFSAVTAAAGQPIAPFFRFPYLADTKSMIGYTQTRAMGVFSIEIDSEDWKTKNAQSIHREVLARLADMGKGILLFHDIQPATAQALPGLLEALRAKGYRVVHLKSKTTATTLPEFDALARDTKARSQVASAAPLAKRSVTWGAAAPAVIARAPGVPGPGMTSDAYSPAVRSAAVARPNMPQQPQQQPFAPYSPSATTPPYGTGQALQPQRPGYAPAPQGEPLPPQPKVARQREPANEDWRDKVFNR